MGGKLKLLASGQLAQAVLSLAQLSPSLFNLLLTFEQDLEQGYFYTNSIPKGQALTRSNLSVRFLA